MIIISFFSLVYNDFIILYFCGLQHNSYSEITSRLYSSQINKVNSYYDDVETIPTIDNNDDDTNSIIE